MSALPESLPYVALALAAALLLHAVRPHRANAPRGLLAFLPWLALVPFGALVARPESATFARAGLATALAIAVLARDRDDLAAGECGLKLTWTLGVALALAWTGESLLTIASGSALTREQWPALALQLDPYALWTSALALALLAGVVLLGGAPFHFWLADVHQGARAWLAPILVSALQVCGAMLLVRRLEGIGGFPAGALLARNVLGVAAGLALAGGAATLAAQRRPERSVGTLASLQGGLVLATLAADPAHAPMAALAGSLAPWAAHLALASTGAGALARFLPVDGRADAAPAALFRRHRWSGVVGLYALLSLAGAPGTPGARVWLDAANALALSRRTGLLVILALAWVTAFAVAANAARRAFGSPSPSPPPERDVPFPARASLWAVSLGLVLMMVVR
jgi:NADH:ubiquinone oxidoreductase subunit 2 (subunit N)